MGFGGTTVFDFDIVHVVVFCPHSLSPVLYCVGFRTTRNKERKKKERKKTGSRVRVCDYMYSTTILILLHKQAIMQIANHIKLN